MQRIIIFFSLIILFITFSCSYKVKIKSEYKVFKYKEEKGNIRTFSLKNEKQKVYKRYVSLRFLEKPQKKVGIPTRLSTVIDRWNLIEGYKDSIKTNNIKTNNEEIFKEIRLMRIMMLAKLEREGIGTGTPKKDKYPVFINLCNDFVNINGEKIRNCSTLCYFENPNKGNCIELEFIPEYDKKIIKEEQNYKYKYKIFLFQHNPVVFDVLNNRVVLLTKEKICSWYFKDGYLNCEKINLYLRNPVIYVSPNPDYILLAERPLECKVEVESNIFTHESSKTKVCNPETTSVCIYSLKNKKHSCVKSDKLTDIIITNPDILLLNENEVLITGDVGVYKLNLLSKNFETVLEYHTYLRASFCSSDPIVCNYLLETFTGGPGYIYVLNGKIYKNLDSVSAVRLLFGTDKLAAKKKILRDYPNTMITVLIVCEKGLIWQLVEESIKKLESVIPLDFIVVKDINKILSEIKVSKEILKALSSMIIDKKLNFNDLQTVLASVVKDENSRTLILNSIYYFQLLTGTDFISLSSKKSCETKYYIDTSVLNLKTGSILLYKKINLPFNLSKIPSSFIIKPFKLANKYFILFVGNSAAKLKNGNLEFKIMYLIISAEGFLVSYKEERYSFPIKSIKCNTNLEFNLEKLPSSLINVDSISNVMEISYCKIEIENVDYVKRVIESLPSDVKLSEYKNLVTIEVLRKNGKKDIYDLYFNPIFENSMAR